MKELFSSIKGKFIALRDMVVTVINDHLSGRITIGLGMVLIVATLGFIINIPCPTKTQYQVLRIVLAVGSASLLLGFLSFLSDGKWIAYLKATWVGAIFFIAYSTNPASLVITDDCHLEYRFIEGQVMLAGDPVEGVRIKLSEQDQSATTNNTGAFFLPYFNDGSLSQSKRIRLQWADLDTLVSITQVRPGEVLRIEIPKIIKTPTTKRISALVNDRIDKLNATVEASHKGLLDNYASSEEVTINQLLRTCIPYENKGKSERNYYRFNNSFSQLQYKKNLVEIGINPNDYKLNNSFTLEFFRAFLLEKNIDQDNVRVVYGLQNQQKVSFDIITLLPQANGQCHVIVEYDEPVRYLFVTKFFDKVPDDRRQRRMEFTGLKPIETLVLHRKHKEWKLLEVE